MSEENLKLIPVVVFLFVLLLGYISLFFKGKTKNEKIIERARKNGTYVKATMSKVKHRLGADESSSDYLRYDSCTVTYEYTVNGIVYKKKLRFTADGMVSVKYPASVIVYYDKNKPQKGVCRENTHTNTSMGCLTIIVVAVIMFYITYYVIRLL